MSDMLSKSHPAGADANQTSLGELNLYLLVTFFLFPCDGAPSSQALT